MQRTPLLFLLLLPFLCTGQDSIWTKINAFQDKGQQLDYVLAHGGKILYSDPSRLDELAQLAASLGEDLDDPRGEAGSMMFNAQALAQKGALDSAIAMQQQALYFLRKEGKETSLNATIYNLLSIYYFRTGRIDKQAAYNDSALQEARKHNMTGFIPVLMMNRAYIMNELGYPEQTNDILQELFRKYNAKEPRTQEIAGFLSSVCMNLATNFRELGKHDSAMYFDSLAVVNARSSGEFRTLASALCELATGFEAKGRLEAALAHILEADSIFRELEDQNGIQRCLQQLVSIRISRGELQEADAAVDEAVTLAQQLKSMLWLKSAWLLKARVEKERNNPAEALAAYEQYMEMADSLNAMNIKDRLAELEIQHQAREKERELQLLKKDRELAGQRQNIIYTVAGAIIVLLFLVVLNLRISARNRKLKSEREKERLLFEMQRKEEDIEQKSRQLTSKALHLSERNELLEELLNITAGKEGGDAEKALRSIERKIRTSLSGDSEWNEFRKYFEEVNQHFFQKLHEAKPDLTEREQRLLALIRIGLNIKEIANLLHIEPNSVKIARYRLKKKFELGQDDTLENFLKQL